jgi:surfeit locus 1 family protein
VVRLARRDIAALALALAAAAVCARLGVWQLDRLRERRERNAILLAARERPPLEVTRALVPDSARGRRLHARGVYDYSHERLWRARTYKGVPGVALITPLRLADGAVVFVDRGWASSPDAYHVDQRAYREADSADVVGIGMAAPRARGDVDPARLRDSLPYPVLPLVLVQAPPSTALHRRPPPGPIRWPAPELTDGPHLSYAIQWFSFAAIILVGSAALARRERRGRGGVRRD